MWSSHRNSFSTSSRKTERGSVTVPLLLLMVVLAGAGFSALTYSLLWQAKVSLQLRLDRCVEETAIELAGIQNHLEESNLRMRAERAAAIAAAVPSAGTSLKVGNTILAAEMLLQEGLRAKWKLREGVWILRRGCHGKSDFLLPLPRLRWWRPPDDAVGAMPLQWEGAKEHLAIRIWKENRFSQAEVGIEKNGTWNGKWTPRARVRTNSN